MTTVAPISPNEITKIREGLIPNVVFETFNKLIAKNFSGSQATVYQEAVMTLLVEHGLSRSDIFDNHWLDVEDSYRKTGWAVEYDKPGYNENYKAYFIFKKK